MQKNQYLKNKDKGFSFIESLVSLLIFMITFAMASPLFFNQTKSNIKSEIKTGAISLSQQVLDRLRLENTLTPGRIDENNLSTGQKLNRVKH